MGVSIMFSISLLLLIPIAVSSSPISLLSQAESLKSILRVVDRDPTYAGALARVGARTYRCIDAVDDAIDDDIDDAKDAFILSKVVNFITKYKTAILSYSKNRFSISLITNMVSPIMMSDLAQLCRDIGGRPATAFKNDRTFLPRIAGNVDVDVGVSSSPVSMVSQTESLKSILRVVDRDPTYAGALARVGARA